MEIVEMFGEVMVNFEVWTVDWVVLAGSLRRSPESSAGFDDKVLACLTVSVNF